VLGAEAKRGGTAEQKVMPIFEYKCSDCSARFERIVRRTEEEIVCPSCNGRMIDKLISAFAVLSAPHAHTPLEACAAGPCGSGACAGGGCALPD